MLNAIIIFNDRKIIPATLLLIKSQSNIFIIKEMIYLSFLDTILVFNPASLRTQLFFCLRLPNTRIIDISYHL